MKTKQVYGRLLVYAKPYKLLAITFLIVSMISSAISIFEGFLLQKIVDYSIERNLNGTLNYIFVTVGIIALGIMVTYFARTVYGKFISCLMSDFRKLFHTHVQRLEMKEIESKKTGDILSRFTSDLSDMEKFFGEGLFDLCIQSLLFVGAFGYLCLINWRLLLACIVFSPVAIGIVIFASTRIAKHTYLNGVHIGNANAVVQDAINGIAMVKSLNAEAEFEQKYQSFMDKSLITTWKWIRTTIVIMPLQVALRWLPNVICVSYGGYLAINGRLSAGTFMAFIYLLPFVFMPLATFTDQVMQLMKASGTVRRVMEILDMPKERDSGVHHDVKPQSSAIKFSDVSFSYVEGTKAVDGVNLTIKQGEKIAIVGHSGSGKTTLAKLICGFYEPDSGSIEILGNSIEQYTLDSLRRKVSYLMQDSYLFPVSVMENISYGDPTASMEHIIAAAKLANAHHFIMELPEGYQTLCSEQGGRFSGGQKQRISLARTILRGAPICLMDEPTSALDMESEGLIQQSLNKALKHQTVIMIAHRLSTIKQADRIIVMNEGKIIEQGSHSKLLEAGGLYKQLFETQI